MDDKKLEQTAAKIAEFSIGIKSEDYICHGEFHSYTPRITKDQILKILRSELSA